MMTMTVVYPGVIVRSAHCNKLEPRQWQCYAGLVYDRLCLDTCVTTSASMLLAIQTLKLAVGSLAVSASLCIQTAASDLSQYRSLLVIYLTTCLFWLSLRRPPFNLELTLLRMESYIYFPV